MTDRRFWIVMSALAGLLVVPSARAEHFNITVPVELHKMVQGVARAKVFCEVLSESGERLGAKYGDWLDINNGELNTQTPIRFNTYNGKNPYDAARYRCHLELLLPWVQDQPWQQPPGADNNLYLSSKPGTELHIIDEGEIPSAPGVKNAPKRLPLRPKLLQPRR